MTAHPDDVDFGAAGAVAAFTSAGVEVTYCIVTNGEAGGSDRTMSRAEMAALRQDEQRAAAAVVGVNDVRFLGHPDGMVQATLQLRRDISRVIRQVRPERVSPNHPSATGTPSTPATPTTWPRARPPSAPSIPTPAIRSPTPSCSTTRGSSPGPSAELWIMARGPAGRGVAVETTATVERKVAALLCHKSQIGDPEGSTQRIREWAGHKGELAGLPAGSSAELFRVTLIP